MRKYFLNLLLLIAALPVFSQSVITYPSSGNIATEEWVQNYLFDQLEKYNISDCDLRIDTIFQDGSAIELGLKVSLPDLSNYSIRIIRGSQTWFWNAVPYTVGERMRIEGVPQLDSVRITIRPTAHPTCYIGFNYNLGGGDNTDPTEPTDPGNPTIPACSAGPLIQTITNQSQTGLTATFHGNGVTNIAWTIRNVSSQVVTRTGNLTPTSSTVSITYPLIAAGNYQLTFSGVNCTGTSSLNFTVTANPTDPDPEPDPSEDNVQPFVTYKGFSSQLDLQVTGTSKNWVFNDNSNYALQSGYTWWYMIGSDVISSQNKLTNYSYQSNNPVRILKMAFKTEYGQGAFNKWTSNPADESGGYYKMDAGQTFAPNSSGGYVIIIFK